MASEFMELKMVAEIDKQYVDHPGGGGGNVATAIQKAENLLNLVTAQYEQQFGIVLDFEVFVDGNGHDFGTSNYETLLYAFDARWWNTQPVGAPSYPRGVTPVLWGCSGRPRDWAQYGLRSLRGRRCHEPL